MLHPTIQDLTKGKFNRYQLTVATAKCARIITDEYVRQRTAAESTLTGSKDSDSILNMVDRELADRKAVKNAIDHINNGDFVIVDEPVKESKAEELKTEEESQQD